MTRTKWSLPAGLPLLSKIDPLVIPLMLVTTRGKYRVSMLVELSWRHFFRSNPVDDRHFSIRRYRRRIFKEWKVRRLFNTTEKGICDKARAIKDPLPDGWEK